MSNSSKYEEIDVPVGQLTIDDRVQRANFSNARVIKIVRDFNPDALGRATVSDRGHGELIVLDGQHRIEAIRRRTDGLGSMPCKVYSGLSLQEEAKLFLDLNDGKMPTLFDRYRVSVTGDDETTVAIDRIVHSHGLTVSQGHASYAKRGTINAILALRKVYSLQVFPEGEEDETVSVLDWTLRTITGAWGNEAAGLVTAVLEGTGRLIYRYWATIELDRLEKAMQTFPGGPVALLAQARQMSSLNRLKVWQNVGQLLVNSYNKGLHEGSTRALSNFTNR